MDSRLFSDILAYLFLDFHESDPFKQIILKDSGYLFYVDDTLLLYPQNNENENYVQKRNRNHLGFSWRTFFFFFFFFFFFDAFQMNIDKLEFNDNHKSTNKNNHIHYPSHHNSKMKNRRIIGSYLNVPRIFNPYIYIYIYIYIYAWVYLGCISSLIHIFD